MIVIKVGIVSMQRVKNHGSFLQAYSLYNVIKKECGADVEFVDFSTQNGIVDNCTGGYRALKKSPIKYGVSRVCAGLAHIPGIGKIFLKSKRIHSWSNTMNYYNLYAKRYDKEFLSRLPISNKTLGESDVEFLVIGSDEVFNYKTNNAVGYSDELFGANSPTDNIISFAACFGCTSIEDIKDEPTKSKLAGYLDRFKAISVRDKNSLENVKYLLGDNKKAEYHLDPVFHYSFEKELPRTKRKKPYIVVYGYDGLKENHRININKYAKKHGLDIVCLHGYQGDFGEYVNATPFEVLSYIKNAECVVTSTFHGCVFSIKYNKQFLVLHSGLLKAEYNNNHKLSDLLDRMKLNDRAVANFDEIEIKMNQPIDFSFANEYINESTKNGVEYLKQHINGEIE